LRLSDTKYPYNSDKQAEFSAAETFAKESKKGLWKKTKKAKSDGFFKSVGKAFFAGVTGQKNLIIKESSKPKSCEKSGKTYVQGYTRSNGTKIKDYWRNNPGKNSSSTSYNKNSSSSSSKKSGKTYVQGYTRSNGTKVKGYYRSKPRRNSSRSSSSSSGKSSGGRVSVRGYTRSNATKEVHHQRSKK